MGPDWGYNYVMSIQTLKITKLARVGTSYGVVIPKSFAREFKWQRGDLLVMAFPSDDTLVIRRLSDKEIIAIKEKTTFINLDTNLVIK